MDVKFVSASKEDLENVPVKDGQIVAVKDEGGFYYDMNGERHNPAEAIKWRGMED